MIAKKYQRNQQECYIKWQKCINTMNNNCKIHSKRLQFLKRKGHCPANVQCIPQKNKPNVLKVQK